MSLANDTALERVAENRWRGEVSERWWIQRGPFGGYVSAFLVRAAIEAVDDALRAPRSFTGHFVDAPQAGPLDVIAIPERVGRSTTSLPGATARPNGPTFSRPARRRRTPALRCSASMALRASTTASRSAGSTAASPAIPPSARATSRGSGSRRAARSTTWP